MQIMSKLLEEVLSKKNMILVYKSTSRVDNVANDEIMVEQDKYHMLSIRDN